MLSMFFRWPAIIFASHTTRTVNVVLSSPLDFFPAPSYPEPSVGLDLCGKFSNGEETKGKEIEKQRALGPSCGLHGALETSGQRKMQMLPPRV